MRVAALFAALALSACQAIQPGPTWHDVTKDQAIWDQVQRTPYIPLERLQVACVLQHGHFTRDQNACMVQKRGVCVFITATGDVSHDAELFAACNGYRA